jgi:hypothetical protein
MAVLVAPTRSGWDGLKKSEKKSEKKSDKKSEKKSDKKSDKKRRMNYIISLK